MKKFKRSQHKGERSTLVLKQELDQWLTQWEPQRYNKREIESYLKAHDECFDDLFDVIGNSAMEKYYKELLTKHGIHSDPRTYGKE